MHLEAHARERLVDQFNALDGGVAAQRHVRDDATDYPTVRCAYRLTVRPLRAHVFAHQGKGQGLPEIQASRLQDIYQHDDIDTQLPVTVGRLRHRVVGRSATFGPSSKKERVPHYETSAQPLPVVWIEA